MSTDPDAVVIGAGPNGLVAANLLADAGWRVAVLEAQAEPGGAVKSAPGPAPGYVRDLFSAVYPLAAGSPVIRALGLEEHGLRWEHPATVLAHPRDDGTAVLLDRDPQRTAAGLDELDPGDGAAWLGQHALWRRVAPALLDAMFTPFPPVADGLRLAALLRPAGLLRFARQALLPVRRLVAEEFAGPSAGLLLTGAALHVDLLPEASGSGLFGWLLAMLGHEVGWPAPRGGAGALTAALTARLAGRGGQLVCSAPVREVLVRAGRAVGVRTADGREVGARRAVLADVPAPALYGGLVDWAHLPARLADDVRRFDWDHATFKVDWALSAPVPWSAPGVAAAGTVHVAAGGLDGLSAYAAQLARGLVPARPFLLVGQMAAVDASRAPAGGESLWAYTHLPRRIRGDAGSGVRGGWDAADRERFADRIEQQVERLAPGFRERVVARVITSPRDLERADPNLVGGSINGGTAALHQQLFLRPVPGLGRPETPVAGLYLASASAHPGGGVHGACGANAARAALRGHRLRAQRGAARLSRALIGDR